MNYLRKVFVSFLSGLLMISLIGFAIFSVAGQTIRDKEVVKSWIDDSGFHDSIISSVTDQIDQQPSIKEADSANPEIRGVIEKTFDTSISKDATNQIIDGFYAWLDNKDSEKPLNVDLKDTKQRLADNLGAYAAERIDDLPPCTPVELGAMSTGTNPLTATCRPPSYSKTQITNQVNANVLSSLSFLPDNYGVQESSNNGTEWANLIRKIYKLSGFLPIVFILLFVSSILMLLLVVKYPWYRVAMMAGWSLVISGIGIGVFSILLTEAPDAMANLYKSLSRDLAGQDIVSKIVLVIANDIGMILRWYAGSYIVLGLILAITGGSQLKRSKTRNLAKNTDVGSINSRPPLL